MQINADIASAPVFFGPRLSTYSCLSIAAVGIDSPSAASMR